MSELHQGAAVTDENGQILNNDDLADLFSTADKVEFWFEKLRRGKVVKRAKISIEVDTDGIDAKAIGDYRRALAGINVREESLRAQAKEQGILDEKGKETDVVTPDKARILNEMAEMGEEFVLTVANLVSKMVTSEPIAGKDLRDPAVLCEREGIGPKARQALYDYFFGYWDEPEAETGATETASIESASDISEATETEAPVPAIS